MKKIRKLGILTGGGDCPGLNAVIRAVVHTACRDYGLEVCGIIDGYAGLIHKNVRRLRAGGRLGHPAARRHHPGHLQPRQPVPLRR